MRNDSLKKSAIALSIALTAWGGVAAHAQTPPTAPPPAPDTTTPSPEQAPNGAATPGTPAPTATAPATPAAPAAPNYNIQYNGLFDGYYMLQSSTPKQPYITGRVYDIRNNTPTLALAELNVYKNARPGGLGFKATLIAGDVAELNHFGFVSAPTGGPAVFNQANANLEGRFKNVQQLYGTYAFAGAGGEIDVGKFYTPFGYEVTESNADYNYSRSIPFALLPVYHGGIRAYTPTFAKGFVLTGYVVQTIYNTGSAGIESDTGTPAFLAQLNYTDPAGKFTFITNLGLGDEKFNPDGFGGKSKTVLSDNDFTYNINSNMLIGLNYVYGSFKSTGNDTKINGYAAYYRQVLTPKTAFALRYSGASVKFDGATELPDYKPYEFTGTYEYKAATNFLTRLEYQHDHTNTDGSVFPFFINGSSNATKSNQDSVTLSGVFSF